MTCFFEAPIVVGPGGPAKTVIRGPETMDESIEWWGLHIHSHLGQPFGSEFHLVHWTVCSSHWQ